MNTKLENASATKTPAHSFKLNQEAIMNRSIKHSSRSVSTLRNFGLIAVTASMMMACGTTPAGVPTPVATPTPDPVVPGPVTPSTFTVSGKVVSLTGQPVPSATVQVIGKPSTTTDSNGNFSIPGVSAPYDVAAVASFGPNSVVTLFKGVTRSDPRVIAFAFSGDAKSATINGSLSGSLIMPTPFGRRTNVAFVASEGADTSGVATNPYTLTPNWFGPDSITGTVHAMQWSVDAAGLPTIYRGYGKLENVPVSNGSTANNKDVALNAVAASILSGNVTVPAGMTLNNKKLKADFGPNTSMGLVSDSTAGTAFSYNTPNIAGINLTASARANGAGGMSAEVFKRNLAANASINLEIPTPPNLSLPVSAASGIDLSSQVFSWAPFNGGLHIVSLEAPFKKFYVFTAASSVTLPSTASLGLGTLPASTAFGWQVMGTTAMVSTDAITDPSSAPINNSLAAPNDYATGISQTNTFTTN
jgi:Carboxypeptidase regulatory-like domain